MKKSIKKLYSKIRNRFKKKLNVLPDTGWFETEFDNLKWRFNLQHRIDKDVAAREFEPVTTDLVKKIVKPGMNVLDIGANIGYFTLIMGKLVGNKGNVWAFEPVDEFYQQASWHIRANKMEGRAHLLDFALSESAGIAEIIVDDVSATMHSAEPTVLSRKEMINLDSLDNVCEKLSLPHIDFVKIDTDGHEPSVFKGGKEFFNENKPIIVVEFAQLVLDEAKSNVDELKELIESYSYTLYSEKTLKPFGSRREFLLECGNYTHSSNVWAVAGPKLSSLRALF